MPKPSTITMEPPGFVPTPIDDIPKMYDGLKRSFASGRTKSIAYRKDQLLRLAYMIKDNVQEFHEALAKDLGRSDLEASLLDIQPTLQEIMQAYNGVQQWVKPEKATFDANWYPMSPVIHKVPKGTVLLISPFNYPIFLALHPLAGAIAAGCTAMLKLSESAPHVASLISILIPQYLDPDAYKVVNGAVPEATKLLELQWDHGSGRVAKVVLAAAAKHLTPVTTELGGKNPVFLDPKTDLKVAAKRILWGKFANCGQTCVAPDYVLVPAEAEEAFVRELLEVYASFYPESPRDSDSYSRMATTFHTERMRLLLQETGGTIAIGGETDIEQRYVAPTIVRGVTTEDVLMQDEIFGPILALVTVNDVNEALKIVNARDHPLAVYIFTEDNGFKAKVIGNTQSGAAVTNEVMIHVGATGLPFGGIGPSGSGSITGKFGFDTFTHQRSSLQGRNWVDKFFLGGRFPPYTEKKAKSLAFLGVNKLPSRPEGLGTLSGTFGSPRTDDTEWRLLFLLIVLTVGAIIATAQSVTAWPPDHAVGRASSLQ